MKTVLVMTMTVLAFTASHSLPRAHNPASHEGQKVKGEEGGKQRDDPICSTDGAGHLTCNNLGFCAANGDKPSDEFYRCMANTDGNFKKELCTCSEGYIFSDVDPNEPCVNNSSLVDRQERLFFSGESETVLYECRNEETTTTESSNPTTTESSNPTTTESSNPTTTESSNPTTTESSNPTTTESSNPTTTESSKPTTTESSNPTTTESSNPTTTESSTPTTTESSTPTTTESSNPTTTESSTITATETNTDPEQNSTTPTKEPPTPTPPFTCEKLGSFPDPQDCHKYYYCAIDSSGILTTENRTCGPGQYFDPQDSICEIGSCINPTIPPPFKCESLGEFQDPADCHYYYICVAGPDGQFKQSKPCKCDDGMYFDPEFSSCAYGTCP